MARKSILAFLATIVIASTVQRSAAQTTHTVGGTTGWTVPSEGATFYSTWASNQTFSVGDFLVFNFTTGTHDVTKVNKADYDACTTTNAITTVTSGPTRITVNGSGEHYFICGFASHCDMGQKLTINVTSSSALAPAPQTATPSPPPVSAPSPVQNSKRNVKTVIGLTVSAGIICFLIVAYLLWRWLAKHREIKQQSLEMLLNERNHAKRSNADNINLFKLQELPVFNLQKLITATDNFHVKNKLGQGGFGPVYKGEFPDGQEIAVKRLSRVSGQGFEEFMNEVVVISKLQHRNLVRLFGCCVQGDEKMLVYEYLPNKSLDAFLFDPKRKEMLDWRKRLHIAEGICRGLLYLHRDSRLRIIHRDLKASNILLDQQLNPKISDFGMARIFGVNEDQANTNRVVGTYGYMSPEYAMDGIFSEKSDVYSLGVLLLEIVSGRRNTSFYENDEALSLIGFAWKLWNEGNIEALKDSVLDSDPSTEAEFKRCINVGLLCVQDFAKDRPNVSTVISMLNSEIIELPSPKQPAFLERGVGSGSSQQSLKKCSANMVTVTVLDGR